MIWAPNREAHPFPYHRLPSSRLYNPPSRFDDKSNPFAIGSPKRITSLSCIKGQPGHGLANQVPDPDVIVPADTNGKATFVPSGDILGLL